MPVEIINTSDEALPPDLEAALVDYAPYHPYGEQRNRIVIRLENITWDIRAAFVRVADDHFMIWVSDWHAQPPELY